MQGFDPWPRKLASHDPLDSLEDATLPPELLRPSPKTASLGSADGRQQVLNEDECAHRSLAWAPKKLHEIAADLIEVEGFIAV